LEVALVDTEERPVYQRIATKALHLRELGLSDRVIAQRLGVFPDFQRSLPDDFDL
jgi:hypothetical protein